MFVFELVGHDENHPVYRDLSIGNLERQYHFLRSLVLTSLALERPLLSLEIIKALNYHAISCLHQNAGEWRPCEVTVGPYKPPAFHQVPGLMQMFVDEVNRIFETADPVLLAAFVLWKLNHIHPFINGNGRTARVACYFVLCLKLGGWPDTETILPELIKRDRNQYVAILRRIDARLPNLDLTRMHTFLTNLLNEQTAPPAAPILLPPA